MTISVGHEQKSFLSGDAVLCVNHVTLTHISMTFICRSVQSGRFVTIYTDENMAEDYLEICEVEIYGAGKLVFFIRDYPPWIELSQ